MWKQLTLLTLVLALSGCGMFRKAFGVGDPSGRESAGSTSIYGDWVLATPTDSTGFVGASMVQLQLDPSTFTLSADYPGRPTVVIRGTASRAADGGLLTLVPQSGENAALLGWPAGEPITVVASAADDALVFASPRDLAARPTSIWHKREAAERAGRIPPTGTAQRGQPPPS